MILCGLVSLSFAQEEKQTSEQPVSKDVAAIRLAHNLARYGYTNYSASALIEAARILSEVSSQPLEAEHLDKSEEPEEGAKMSKEEFTPSNLLADAKKFADGDATLLELAAQVGKNAIEYSTRGRVGGPGKTVSKVAARGTDSYTIKFWRGELAEIYLSGDGDTDLDLYVYDESGNLIDWDDDYTDDCYVSWVPRWTGSYVVKVVNRGRVYNRYVLVTN